MKKDGIKFTAIVVTYNEQKYLKSCLESLSFCDQIIVVDLGSTDSCVAIAKEAGAEVLRHERVPVVEKVRGYALEYARNGWVIFQDPDEVLPASLAAELPGFIEKHPEAAFIRAPIQFYFKGKPLTCCIWGAPGQSKILLVHKERVRFRPLVHRFFDPVEGYETVSIKREGDNFIRHYWIDSYNQLFEKHLRYIKQEGESRYNSGERFSWRGTFYMTLCALKNNLIDCRGLRGGLRGVFLSLFYGWYIFMSHLSLRKYERGAVRR